MINDVFFKAITLLNNGVSLSDASRMLGVNRSQLSRRLNTMLKRGLLSRYLNVFINHLRKPVSIVITETRQKLSRPPCLLGRPPVVISYYSYAGRPVLISYVGEDYSGVSVDSVANTSVCRVIIYGKVLRVLLPFRDPSTGMIGLEDPESFMLKEVFLDDVDDLIALELFRLFNPSTMDKWTLRDLAEVIKARLGISDVYYHLSRHVSSIVRRRYIYRGGGTYSLTLVASDKLSSLVTLINQLVGSGILVDVEQVNLVSESPYTGLVHGWVSLEKLYDPFEGHDFVERASYTIYPVFTVTYDSSLISSVG